MSLEEFAGTKIMPHRLLSAVMSYFNRENGAGKEHGRLKLISPLEMGCVACCNPLTYELYFPHPEDERYRAVIMYFADEPYYVWLSRDPQGEMTEEAMKALIKIPRKELAFLNSTPESLALN